MRVDIYDSKILYLPSRKKDGPPPVEASEPKSELGQKKNPFTLIIPMNRKVGSSKSSFAEILREKMDKVGA